MYGTQMQKMFTGIKILDGIKLFSLVIPVIIILYLFSFAKHKTSKKKLDGFIFPSNVHLVQKMSQEERKLAKESFLVSPDYQWIAGYDPEKDSDNEVLKSNHVEISNYQVECALRFAEEFGTQNTQPLPPLVLILTS